MLRALGGVDAPPSDLARHKADDTERTRMLKDVMKSVAKYQLSNAGKPKNESAMAAAQLALKAQEEEEEQIKRDMALVGRDPTEWGYFSATEERSLRSTLDVDKEILEFAAGADFHELLKYSGGLVNGFSNSLSSKTTLPERPPHIDSSPADGICLVPRHEAEDIVAGGATDHKRREQAAWSWVQDNVKFKELDKLQKQIEDSSKYEDVRKHFEAHHKYHPILHELTDHALTDESIWQRALQEAMYPRLVEDKKAAPKAQTGWTAPKAISRKSVGLGSNSKASLAAPNSPKNPNKVSWASNAAGGAPPSKGNRSSATTMPGRKAM